MQPSYPIAHWYVAASDDEIGRELLARTVCGQPLVMFRTEAGEVVVMDDRCSHRGFPLSAGALIGDRLQCGYHGLQFDECGTCVWAPGQDRIPSSANVRVRPSVRTGPWVWVWMGEPETADLDAVPEIPWVDDEGWAVVHGMEPLAARYGLLIDNLLDLSHETFLHGGYIGTPEVAETPIDTTVDSEAGIVRVSRHMEAVECPPFYENSTGLTTPIDRWQDIEYFAPGFYLLHVRVAPAGTPIPPAGTPDADAVDRAAGAAHVKVLYAITPVDDHNTLDFWGVCRDFALEDAEVRDFMATMNREVVLQDVVALSLIEERLGDDWDPPEVSFKIDTGGLAARRVLAALVAKN